MSDLIVNNNNKKNFHKNIYVNKIIDLMENEEFRDFFDENFDNWMDIKASIMFMKTYQTLDETYQKETGGEKLDRENMLFLMDSMIKDPKYRKSMVDEMIEFSDNKKLKKIKKGKNIKLLEDTKKDDKIIEVNDQVKDEEKKEE